ncbi:MAG: hypothetical protein U1E83_01330 [Methylotetracoccus sp.]
MTDGKQLQRYSTPPPFPRRGRLIQSSRFARQITPLFVFGMPGRPANIDGENHSSIDHSATTFAARKI